MVRLNLIFGSNDEFEKAVDHFENVSDFYPDEKNYRYRQLSFDCNNEEDADMNERAIDKEIMNSFEKYHFEIEDINESKKAKVKTLIERIVERVIAKKLSEAKRSKRRLSESAYGTKKLLSEEVGLRVYGRTKLDNNLIDQSIEEVGFRCEFNPRENYWFFPEKNVDVDTMENELEDLFIKNGINARFEVQTN